MDTMLDKMKTIETLAQEINEFYKNFPSDFIDSDDYETVNVIRNECYKIINASNWTQAQIKMFNNDQTEKCFDSIVEETA